MVWWGGSSRSRGSHQLGVRWMGQKGSRQKLSAGLAGGADVSVLVTPSTPLCLWTLPLSPARFTEGDIEVRQIAEAVHTVCRVGVGGPGGQRPPQGHLCTVPHCVPSLRRMVEYSLDLQNINLSAIRTVRVLRPLKAINRVPSESPFPVPCAGPAGLAAAGRKQCEATARCP